MANVQSAQKSALQLLYIPLYYWSFPLTFLYFSLPIYGRSLGANATAIGGLFSVITLATLLLRPLAGWAVDRYGRKPLLFAGFGVCTLAMGALSFATTVPGLYLARIIQGLGAGILWATAYTIIKDLTRPQEHVQALQRLDETIARGGLLGLFAGSFLFTLFPENLGWQLALLGFTALMGIGAYLVLRLVPETKPGRPHSVRESPTLSRNSLPFLFIGLVTSASQALLAPIYLIYLQDRFTTDIPLLALAFLPGVLATAFFKGRLKSLSDRFAWIPTLALGLLGAGMFSWLLPRTLDLTWLIVLFTLAMIALQLAESANAGLAPGHSGLAPRSWGVQLHEFFGLLGVALGPLIGGLLYDSVYPAAPFYLNGVILLGSSLWVIAALRNRPGVERT